MATSTDGDGSADGQTWDGYSDYKTVSSRIGNFIFDAIDAYADIHSIHVEGASIQPRTAAQARSRILAAAMALQAEMSHERDSDEDIDAILSRWNGSGGGGEDVAVDIPADGFMGGFREISLYEDDPEWLRQFVADLWLAGWELGYLKAGRHESEGLREIEADEVPAILEGI